MAQKIGVMNGAIVYLSVSPMITLCVFSSGKEQSTIDFLLGNWRDNRTQAGKCQSGVSKKGPI